jgi:hypothetical protein
MHDGPLLEQSLKAMGGPKAYATQATLISTGALVEAFEIARSARHPRGHCSMLGSNDRVSMMVSLGNEVAKEA